MAPDSPSAGPDGGGSPPEKPSDTSEVGLPLVPMREPPDDRPQVAARPCAACGAPLDPLRCDRVLPFDDGLRLFCDDSCVQEFRGGKRFRVRPTPTVQTAVPKAQADLASARAAATDPRREGQQPPPANAEGDDTGPHPLLSLGLGLAVLGGLASVFSGTLGIALLSAGLSVSASLCALWLARETASDIGVLAWTLGPLGGIAAAASAFQTGGGADQVWGLSGAALAALALLARVWLDGQATRPLEAAEGALRRSVPKQVKVPVATAEDPFSSEVRLVNADSVRTGEPFIANRGDVVAIDGVVQAGTARVQPHPGASASYARSTGDTVIAGARVLDGDVRVMATRVGDNRTLARVARIGQRAARPSIREPQLAAWLHTWGPFVVIAAAALALLSVETGRLAAPLAAASAVLLMAPLLTLRRATQAPLLASATHASGRGIFFHDAAALERAGSITLAAMAPHRTLTEGKPEVVEVYVLGEGNADDILADVAAAERAAAPEHAIAAAIEAFAQVRQVQQREVRRANYVPGRGVRAVTSRNEELVVGNRRFVLDSGVSVAVADVKAARAESAGRSPVFVALGGRVRAVITLEDHLRVGARAALQRMFDMDLEVVLVTGDQRRPAEKLAQALDVEHVKAELLPEERVTAIRSLREAGSRVAMVGFMGMGDAALAAADVGIVLGGAGGSGRERTITTVSEDIRDAAAALWIARAARVESQRAVQLAVAVFAAVVVAAAAGLMIPAFAAPLAVAVDAHGLSTGTRLLRRFALRLPA